MKRVSGPFFTVCFHLLFFSVTEFEFTSECIVFDLLNIRLLHGWVIDPQNREAVSAISSLSYNQLVEKIIASKQEGVESQLVSEGMCNTQGIYFSYPKVDSLAGKEVCIQPKLVTIYIKI